MIDMNQWLSTAPYELEKNEKQSRLTTVLSNLTQAHFANCTLYRNMLSAAGYNPQAIFSCADVPFLPVRLFKELDLLSVPPESVVKTMTSSGTTGQAVSKIFLDRETSANQMKVLSKIVSSFIGAQRLPMLIIDSPKVVSDRRMFSARGAGILGFSIFATEKIFALDDNMALNRESVDIFLKKHKDKNILVFGFTFMIWQHFYKELLKHPMSWDLSRGILIHGGGWKKLASEAVSSPHFRNCLREVCGINHVHDYYGMVEQTGSIFMECEKGYLHAPIYSDVITRNPINFSPVPFGERGIIEVLSLLPGSYPGHAILTEDEGIVFGEDNCECGRLGKYFRVLGRLKNAEVRGCSDTYAERFS